MLESKQWWQLEIKAPAELIDPLANCLEEIGAEGYHQNIPADGRSNLPEEAVQTLTAYVFSCDADFQTKVSLLRDYIASLQTLFPALPLIQLSAEPLQERDWGEEWKKFYHPLRIGRNLVIKPSWEPFDQRDTDLVLTVDPGMAFGTGHHPTTAMCLEAMEKTLRQSQDIPNRRVLDVGCGTGILAIGAAKMGVLQVTGLDIDPLAVATAIKNAEMNGLTGITFREGTLDSISSSFDLIMANLTCRSLIELRSRLVSRLAPGGTLIATGILKQQQLEMEKEFFLPPLDDYELQIRDEWLCYLCRKGRTQEIK